MWILISSTGRDGVKGVQKLTLGAQSWPALARPKPGGQFGNESEVELAMFGKKIQGELISLVRKKRWLDVFKGSMPKNYLALLLKKERDKSDCHNQSPQSEV